MLCLNLGILVIKCVVKQCPDKEIILALQLRITSYRSVLYDKLILWLETVSCV